MNYSKRKQRRKWLEKAENKITEYMESNQEAEEKDIFFLPKRSSWDEER